MWNEWYGFFGGYNLPIDAFWHSKESNPKEVRYPDHPKSLRSTFTVNFCLKSKEIAGRILYRQVSYIMSIERSRAAF